MATLVAYCTGGLGNRLKVLCSTQRLANLLQVDFQVCWDTRVHDNSGIGYEIEVKNSDLDITNLIENNFNMISHDELIYGDFKRNPIITREIDFDCFLCDWRWQHYEDESDIDFLEDSPLHQEILPYLLSLRPAKNIRDEIDSFIEKNQIGLDTIGVHIRKYHPGMMHYNEEDYYKEIDKIYDGGRIFLCTDGERDSFIKRYPNTVHFGNSSGTVETIRDGSAFIDMHILSKCGTIIGAYGSTFNEVAWWLSSFKAKRILLPYKFRFKNNPYPGYTNISGIKEINDGNV